jgi:hypothetical protein
MSSLVLDNAVFHHTERTDGCYASYYIVPGTPSGTICLTKSMARIDVTHLIDQQLIGVLLGQRVDAQAIIDSAMRATSSHTGLYRTLETQLNARKQLHTPPTVDLIAFKGTYHNTSRNFTFIVHAPPDSLRVGTKGSIRKNYDLRPLNGDKFYWPPVFTQDAL